MTNLCCLVNKIGPFNHCVDHLSEGEKVAYRRMLELEEFQKHLKLFRIIVHEYDETQMHERKQELQ